MRRKKNNISQRYASDAPKAARALVAEELMARYGFSATEAVFSALADDYRELMEAQDFLAMDSKVPGWTGSVEKQRERWVLEWKDLLKRCEKIIPLELATKRAGDSDPEVDTNPAHTGPQHAERSRDPSEWFGRHQKGDPPTLQ